MRELTEQNERVGPIAWMARNPIAANLLMILLLVGGLWTGVHMQKEVFPQFQLDVVRVNVGYPGSAPAEVEKGIILPIEEAIRGVQGIREISSTAREGSGSVRVELVSGADRMKVYQEIDQAVNRIRTFPEDIDEPEVQLQSREREVMEIGLFGQVDIWTLRKTAEQVRDRMLTEPTITSVRIGRVPDYMTHVEIPRSVLREYGLTLGEVARIIGDSSEDLSAGTVESQSGEILLRMNERRDSSEEFGRIEIVAGAEGGTVLLRDIATLTDGFVEEGFHSRFNQTPSVELNVYRIGSQSPLDIEDAVRNVMAEVEPMLPAGVTWRVDSSSARDFRDRLGLLIENGLSAMIIVLVILALFLELRLAFWVMMGMTVSFVGGLVFLPVIGVSINMISMFAFLVVIGIVVDDAIVVGENTYGLRQQGLSAPRAAVAGAREVAMPVTFSILTNVIAFVPLLFIPGETGKFWWTLPAVVIVVLLLSLFEALFILPAHLAHVKEGGRSRVGARFHGLQQRFGKGFDRFVQTRYRDFLDLCLRYRYVTLTLGFALFVVVGGYGLSSHIGRILMPEVAADEIEAGVRLPVGTTPDQAAEIAAEVTESSMRMFEEHDLHLVAEGIKTNVRGGNFIDVEIVMKPPGERDMTAREVIALWRDEIGDLRGVDQVTFEAERGPGGWRQDISVDLSHDNVEVLEKASEEFVGKLEEFSTTADVSDNYERGKPRLDFRILPEGRALGLNADEIGRQVRDAFFGALALRQLRGTNEVEVRVKLTEEERKDLFSLKDFVIQTPAGAEVSLLDVVEVNDSEAFASINRRDGRRVVTVSTDVDPKRAINQVLTALNEEVLPELRAKYPGLTTSFQGSQAEMRESTQALWAGFAIAMVVIYALLAVAFGSYLQPFIVLLAIPFGIVGAVIGHILLGYDLSLISMMGIIALSGVVVNDSLIMVSFANRTRSEDSAFVAIRKAGVRRFRPISLTTLTTFGGLMPILLETSQQAQYLIPMAISLGFGIVFATAIILVLVPCFYLALEDLKEGLRR